MMLACYIGTCLVTLVRVKVSSSGALMGLERAQCATLSVVCLVDFDARLLLPRARRR